MVEMEIFKCIRHGFRTARLKHYLEKVAGVDVKTSGSVYVVNSSAQLQHYVGMIHSGNENNPYFTATMTSGSGLEYLDTVKSDAERVSDTLNAFWDMKDKKRGEINGN